MFILILGASASGKSEFAENLCVKLANNQKKLYIATMEPFGDDATFRINRHKKLRANKGFNTVEIYRNLQNFDQKENDTILLECMSTLLANEFFTSDNYRQNISLGIEKVLENCENLILISNNVFSDGENYDKQTVAYMKELARFNVEFSKKADVVIEVICSIPVYLKGKEVIYGFDL
ncbi:MAG: bifunctional adenosylcobinamide kinase/adenosylcobinamide-phosphate guanylyltransferase [Clostridia bacterium]